MNVKFRTELHAALDGVRGTTGLSLEFEETGGGCWALSGRLETGHIIVATELDGPWNIGIYQPCNGTRKCLQDDEKGTHYPNGCGHWCDYETAEFFEFPAQFEQLSACIAKALSLYMALADRHAVQPINEHGHPDARVHSLDRVA